MLIENSNFLVKEIPKFNPILDYYEYWDWWKEQKRRCIDGYWVGGKWMPGPLYYYVNFHTILFEQKGQPRKPGRPWLRDIDWEMFLIYEEARGFSGWDKKEKDHTTGKLISGRRDFGPEVDKALMLGDTTEAEINKHIYAEARSMLRSVQQSGSLGLAQYDNEAKNVFSMQARGGGKSYGMSGIIVHNFLFDGAKSYDAYLEAKSKGEPFVSDTVIGAVDTKYTTPLLGKVKRGLSSLPGKVKFNGVEYPSPLTVPVHGSWQSGASVYSQKSESVLHHRTFNDNPLAANGTRPNLAVIDEIGFLHNILEVLPALESTQTSSDFKTLVVFGFGTGGLVRGKAVRHAEEVFSNPEPYNALEFDDPWENSGKIGYFVPAHKTLNKYKEGPNLITNVEKAKKEIEYRIEQAKKAKNRKKEIGEIINRPETWKDCFLSIEGTYFSPVAPQLKNRLKEILSNRRKYMDSIWKGDLIYDDMGVLHWEDQDDVEPLHEYPVTRDDIEGCIVLYEKPVLVNGQVPSGVYIGAADVVDKAASTTDSLFSVGVMNRLTRRIVAEFFGRSKNPKRNYERALRLWQYYNAIGMYEQNLTGMYTHFEARRALHRLADTPIQLRSPATFIPGSNTSKGINATTRVNSDGRKMYLSYLQEPLSDKNPDHIVASEMRSPGIIRETLAWESEGNYDRVSMMIMMMWYDNTLYHETMDEFQARQQRIKKQDSYWAKMGVLKKDKFGTYTETGTHTEEDEFDQKVLKAIQAYRNK